jgi:hypothetical protein
VRPKVTEYTPGVMKPVKRLSSRRGFLDVCSVGLVELNDESAPVLELKSMVGETGGKLFRWRCTLTYKGYTCGRDRPKMPRVNNRQLLC